MNVSAVLVTRGDVGLNPILDSFTQADCFKEVIVWDNSNPKRDDLAVYGRYAAVHYAKHDLIYVQDDDCVLPPESIEGLIEMWSAWAEHPGNPHGDSLLASNMPAAFRHDFYSDHCLVGFGAVFHRDLPERAFERFNAGLTMPGVCPPHWSGLVLFDNFNFRRTCDIVFTALTPRVLVDVPYQNLPWAEDESRMYRSENHVAERTRMLELVRKVRDA